MSFEVAFKTTEKMKDKLHIVLLCATPRGYRFAKKLAELLPAADLTVFSFNEENGEPRFLEDLRQFTLTAGGRFFEGKQVGAQQFKAFWEATPFDLMFAVNWRYMVPAEIYSRARLGAFVFHDSLLPEYRGFSPVVWAMVNGEDHTGVTLFEMAEKVDAGDIIGQVRIAIGRDDTITVVMERVTQAYLELLEQNLAPLLEGAASRYPQDHSHATFTCKRIDEDNQIDWTACSEQIHNLIRAVTMPYPGAYTYLMGKKLRIWSAQRVFDYQNYIGRIAGRVVEVHPGKGSVVLTGDGALLLTRAQLEGGDLVCAADILNRITQTLGQQAKF